ncbi:MAG: efflux RND transporter periplasmic adaptor subunit, partial [Pseudomonadota bacterium]|nr:efflux RND transporter periplasmic adaptor subunit [Pseudomonadota bacterium]
MKRIIGLLAVSLALAACNKGKTDTVRIQTVPVGRQSIRLDAQATGTVEPINVVEVKSKASGLITKMTVETGALVKAGDLLVQIDTRDVQNQFNQSNADVQAARENLKITLAQKKRSDDLFSGKIITATEHEAAVLAASNAQAQLVRTEASLDLSKQRLEDATVRAPVAGTVIDKTVSLGTVITSATSGPTGGTTLLKMADLTRVRVRAFVNETDIGQVQPGQEARVTVDAHPDRPFQG